MDKKDLNELIGRLRGELIELRTQRHHLTDTLMGLYGKVICLKKEDYIYDTSESIQDPDTPLYYIYDSSDSAKNTKISNYANKSNRDLQTSQEVSINEKMIQNSPDMDIMCKNRLTDNGSERFVKYKLNDNTVMSDISNMKQSERKNRQSLSGDKDKPRNNGCASSSSAKEQRVISRLNDCINNIDIVSDTMKNFDPSQTQTNLDKLLTSDGHNVLSGLDLHTVDNHGAIHDPFYIAKLVNDPNASVQSNSSAEYNELFTNNESKQTSPVTVSSGYGSDRDCVREDEIDFVLHGSTTNSPVMSYSPLGAHTSSPVGAPTKLDFVIKADDMYDEDYASMKRKDKPRSHGTHKQSKRAKYLGHTSPYHMAQCRSRINDTFLEVSQSMHGIISDLDAGKCKQSRKQANPYEKQQRHKRDVSPNKRDVSPSKRDVSPSKQKRDPSPTKVNKHCESVIDSHTSAVQIQSNASAFKPYMRDQISSLSRAEENPGSNPVCDDSGLGDVQADRSKSPQTIDTDLYKSAPEKPLLHSSPRTSFIEDPISHELSSMHISASPICAYTDNINGTYPSKNTVNDASPPKDNVKDNCSPKDNVHDRCSPNMSDYSANDEPIYDTIPDESIYLEPMPTIQEEDDSKYEPIWDTGSGTPAKPVSETPPALPERSYLKCKNQSRSRGPKGRQSRVTPVKIEDVLKPNDIVDMNSSHIYTVQDVMESFERLAEDLPQTRDATFKMAPPSKRKLLRAFELEHKSLQSVHTGEINNNQSPKQKSTGDMFYPISPKARVVCVADTRNLNYNQNVNNCTPQNTNILPQFCDGLDNLKKKSSKPHTPDGVNIYADIRSLADELVRPYHVEVPKQSNVGSPQMSPPLNTTVQWSRGKMLIGTYC